MANERRLIDLEELELEYGGFAKISPYDFAGICKYFVEQLEALPTVDAVEVVRCKDCKYIDQTTHCSHPAVASARFMKEPYDYCSYGERRCE